MYPKLAHIDAESTTHPAPCASLETTVESTRESPRILITGATGFVGRHCIKHLQALGWSAHAVSHRSPPDDYASGLQWHALNLMDFDRVEGFVSELRPTHLLHLAHEARPGYFWEAAENLDWIRASLHLFQCFYDAGGQRCVATGSCAEYGPASAPCFADKTPTVPKTTYGWAKLSIYGSLVAQARIHQASYAWPRLFHLYGPHTPSGKMPGLLIDAFLKGETVTCQQPSRGLDFLYIDDAARALIEILRSDFQGAINVASGQCVSLGELTRLVAEQLECTHLFSLKGQTPSFEGSPLLDRLVADITPLSQELKFHPRTPLIDGLQLTIAWHRLQQTIRRAA